MSSFADANDTLYMAGLDPAQLLREGSLLRGSMLIQAGDGEWAAVSHVTVGYGGTGPSNAHRTLAGLGIDEALARRIAYSRVSDVAFDGGPAAVGTPLHTNDWPHVGLSAPRPHGERWVVSFGLDGLLEEGHDPEYDTLGGIYPKASPTPHLEHWLAWLDDAPQWAAGSRRARVYLSPQSAIADGFTADALAPWDRDRTVFAVILQQGPLQLWLSLPDSTDPTIQFAPETYEVLRRAGFYVDDREAQDSRNAFWRWLGNLGKTRPPFVDLAGPITTSR